MYEGGEERCPTEAKCEKWNLGADYDQVFYYIEKKHAEDQDGHQPSCAKMDGKRLGKNGACIACPMLPTKPGIEKVGNQEIVQRIERLSLESALGFPVQNYCSLIEWELLLTRQAAKEQQERIAGIRQSKLIEALASRG